MELNKNLLGGRAFFYLAEEVYSKVSSAKKPLPLAFYECFYFVLVTLLVGCCTYAQQCTLPARPQCL